MAKVSPSNDPVADSATEALYGLDELLELAGQRLGEEITPRTVRLYATQGLIDRPGKEGRSAVYGHRQLLQLLLIRSMARRGLSLSAIAPHCVLPDSELEQQLSLLEDAAEPLRALEEACSNPALAYLRGLESGSPARSNSTLPLGPLGSPLSTLSPSSSSLRSSSRPSSRTGSSRDAASRWHRFSLAPGVELQISDSVSIPPPGTRRLNWLQRLGDRLNELLDQFAS
jgi:DNA-binding transcriptional MerR regulator